MPLSTIQPEATERFRFAASAGYQPAEASLYTSRKLDLETSFVASYPDSIEVTIHGDTETILKQFIERVDYPSADSAALNSFIVREYAN